MTTIKVHFEDKQGNTNEVVTNISGTPEEIIYNMPQTAYGAIRRSSRASNT